MTDSTFVCVLFGQESSNKWWNIEETGFATENDANKHGTVMMKRLKFSTVDTIHETSVSAHLL